MSGLPPIANVGRTSAFGSFAPMTCGSGTDWLVGRAHVPARDFDESKQFYQDFGFDLVWTTADFGILPAR